VGSGAGGEGRCYQQDQGCAIGSLGLLQEEETLWKYESPR
jgi:hypothetical protein